MNLYLPCAAAPAATSRRYKQVISRAPCICFRDAQVHTLLVRLLSEAQAHPLLPPPITVLVLSGPLSSQVTAPSRSPCEVLTESRESLSAPAHSPLSPSRRPDPVGRAEQDGRRPIRPPAMSVGAESSPGVLGLECGAAAARMASSKASRRGEGERWPRLRRLRTDDLLVALRRGRGVTPTCRVCNEEGNQ